MRRYKRMRSLLALVLALTLILAVPVQADESEAGAGTETTVTVGDTAAVTETDDSGTVSGAEEKEESKEDVLEEEKAPAAGETVQAEETAPAEETASAEEPAAQPKAKTEAIAAESASMKVTGNPLKLEIIGLTNGKIKAGKSLSFHATGGREGKYESYWLHIEVDGNDCRNREMINGWYGFTTGNMDNRIDSELPIGVHYKVYAIRAAFNAPEDQWETTAPQYFDVEYDNPSNYRLEVKGAQRLYDQYHEQWALDSPPVLYKNGKRYKDPETLHAVYRYDIKTEKEGRLVSMDGMIKDVGYYTVDTYELFEDEGRVVLIKGNQVTAKIISPEIRIDKDKLDGGKFLFPYNGKAQGISASRISIPGMSKSAYTLSYSTSANGRYTSAPPAYKSGAHTMYVKATFKTSNKITQTAKATVSVEKVSKAAVSSLKNKKGKKAALKIKKVSGASGYEVVYATSKNLKKNRKVTSTKKNSLTLSKLKKKKKYYVQVRAYKADSTGKKIYGAYSKVKSVKIKK